MKYTFKMRNVDCGNCALKIEDRIKKLDGVNDCKVNFLTEKIKLDVEYDKLEGLKPQILSEARKVEEECEIEFDK